MKKILLFTSFLNFLMITGQEKFYIVSEIHYTNPMSIHNGIYEVSFFNNSNSLIFSYNYFISSTTTINFNGIMWKNELKTISNNNYPINFKISSIVLGVISSGYEEECEYFSPYSTFDSNHYFKVSDYDNSCLTNSRTAIIKLKLDPITEFEDPVGSCESIIVSHHVPSELHNNSVRWFYKTNAQSYFVPFPSQYQNSGYNLNFSLNDFPELQNYQGNLHIRYAIVDSNGEILESINNNTIEQFTSDIVTYNIVRCPPSINNSTTLQPTCFDSNDGSIKFEFDRDLNPNEYFLVTLYQVDEFGYENPLGTTQITASDFNNQQFSMENLGPGEYYIKYQTYENGMPSSLITSPHFQITAPPELTFSAFKRDVSCTGENNGIIYFDPSGGTGSLEYSLDGGTTWSTDNLGICAISAGGNYSPCVSNLSPASYEFLIRDENGCIATNGVQSFTIAEPTPLQITVTSTQDPTSPGATDGAIEVEVTGGTLEGNTLFYNYSWTNNQNSNVYTTEDLYGIEEGVYTLTVTDARNCEATIEVTLIDTPAVEVSVSEVAPIDCYGGVTDLQANITGGTAPYQSITWVDSNDQVVGYGLILEDQAADTYLCTVIDYNGIVQSTLYVLNEPTELTAQYVIEEISCHNADDGEIDLSVNGGTAPYTYSWTNSNGNEISTDEDPTGLSTDNYSCEITDANNCTLNVLNINIPLAPDPITYQADIDPITTIGGNEGMIDLDIFGGTPPYTYLWNDNSTNEYLQNLSAGVYTVTVTDANNCSEVFQFTFLDPQPLEVNIDLVQAISCFEGSDGILIANASGGFAPYSYSWTYNGNPINSTQPQIDNLSTGTYTVTVTDNLGSTESAQFELIDPDALEVVVQITQINCFGENTGAIDLTPANPNQTYFYQWYKDGIYIDNTEDLQNLSAGMYKVVVSAPPCSITIDNIEVSEPSEPLTISSFELSNPTGFGLSNGGIDISVLGGTPPYSFSWSNGADTEDLSNVGAGTYTLTITDTNGCTWQEDYTLVEPNELLATISQESSILCNGDSTASLSVAVTGGVSPYQYAWSHDANEISNQLSGLSAGEYEVTVTDSQNNQKVVTYLIEQPDPIVINFESTDVSCSNAPTGSITALVSGGTPPYTYAWNTGETTQSLDNLSVAGNYMVQVTDSNGCQQINSDEVGNELGVSFTYTEPTCENECDGTITLNLEGDVSDYQIDWENNQGSGLSAENLCAGTYQIEITNTLNGCTLPINVQLVDPEPLSLDLGEDVILCLGQSVTIDGTIDAPDATYQWVCDNGFTSDQAEVTLTESGIYTLTATYDGICMVSDDITITALEDEISADFLMATQAYVDEEVILVNVSTDSTQTYNWIFPPEATIVSSSSTDAVISFSQIGTYQLGLEVNHSNGCESTTYRSIVIEEDPGLPDPDEAEEPFVQEFTLYPNPTNPGGNFTVKVVLSEAADISITIYQVGSGSLVEEAPFSAAQLHQHSFDLNISTGVYWVILRTPRNVLSKKLIVN